MNFIRRQSMSHGVQGVKGEGRRRKAGRGRTAGTGLGLVVSALRTVLSAGS